MGVPRYLQSLWHQICYVHTSAGDSEKELYFSLSGVFADIAILKLTTAFALDSCY